MTNNYSKQREEILEVIKNTRIHPTAEEIYEMVKKIDSKMSKSTVYRNIHILVENQTIEKITMKTGPDRFDYFHEPHHHVVCEKCGKVYDFVYDFETEKIAKSVFKQTGVVTEVQAIVMDGICANCKSKK